MSLGRGIANPTNAKAQRNNGPIGIVLTGGSLDLPAGAATEVTQEAIQEEIAVGNDTLTAISSALNSPITLNFVAPTSVSSTSNQVFNADNTTRYLRFQNIDATIAITIVFGDTGTVAIANSQIVIEAGKTIEFSLALGNLDQRQVFAITATGTATLLIAQGT